MHPLTAWGTPPRTDPRSAPQYYNCLSINKRGTDFNKINDDDKNNNTDNNNINKEG